MEIYLDVIFFINFVMNGIIFFIVSKLIKKKVKWVRLVLGSLVASVLYCVMLITLTRYFNLFTAVGILVAGLFTTFGKMPRRQFLLSIVYAHVVAFFIGGTAIGLYHYVHTLDVVAVARQFSFPLLIVSTLGCFMLLKLFFMFVKKMGMSKQVYHQVKIRQGDCEVEVTALVDTGNSLKEPSSGDPVMLVEKESLLNLLMTTNITEKTKVIPFKSVGGEGVLVGFVPDELIIEEEMKPPVCVRACVVGMCEFELSKNGKYRGLLSPLFFADKAEEI